MQDDANKLIQNHLRNRLFNYFSTEPDSENRMTVNRSDGFLDEDYGFGYQTSEFNYSAVNSEQEIEQKERASLVQEDEEGSTGQFEGEEVSGNLSDFLEQRRESYEENNRSSTETAFNSEDNNNLQQYPNMTTALQRNKKGRPKKSEARIGFSNYRTDLIRTKLNRHILNSIVIFANEIIRDIMEKDYKGKGKKEKFPQFKKQNKKFKMEFIRESTEKTSKICDILKEKEDGRAKIFDNLATYNFISKIKSEKLDQFLNMSVKDFVRKFYSRGYNGDQSSFSSRNSIVSEENLKDKKAFFSNLLEKNEEKGEKYLTILKRILYVDYLK